MKTKAFIRRVGFGLRPDENIPKDPLYWAKSQMDIVPKPNVLAGQPVQIVMNV